MLERLLDHDITKIEQIVEINNKLINYEKFKEIIGNGDKKLFNQIKKNLKNKKNDNLQDVISKRLNIEMREEVFDTNDFFYDEEYEGYEVYIDETIKKTKNKPDKAGYGIHFNRKHKYNFYDRVDGEQTLQNATYQGILHVLKKFPLDEPIIFCIDRKAVIDVMENFPTTYREKQDSLHLDTLNQIQEILQQRTAPIQFKHIY